MESAESYFIYTSSAIPGLSFKRFKEPLQIDTDSFIRLYIDPLSLRIRLDDYKGSVPEIVKLVRYHTPDWTEKIIIKSRVEHFNDFSNAGFHKEADVRGYFGGSDMTFLVTYLKPHRRGLAEIKNHQFPYFAKNVKKYHNSDGLKVNVAIESNATELADFYRKNFPLYPTPIGDSGYLRKVISANSVYMFILENDLIVSAACAEIDFQNRNAELSDCATLDGYNGKGYMKRILSSLMEHLREMNIYCFYSIARAESTSMNAVFSHLGFQFTGTLYKNVRIFSGVEDMNVWSYFKAVQTLNN